jgi:beta-glucosidase
MTFTQRFLPSTARLDAKRPLEGSSRSVTADDPARLEALLGALTLDEKALLCAGASLWRGHAVPRLGIPALRVTDGPNGARGGHFGGGASAACFPCGSALAATWSPALVEAVGRALGEEARTKRAHVLLGPTVNMHRSPLGGRHFEGYSEDPLLAARTAAAFVRGVQATGVAACVKHFVANDSEFERMTISSELDARALRELSLPPFEAAVREAGAWALMAAYNGLHGTTCSAHRGLLVELLRDEWGFRGVVMSDWYGTKDTVASARNGLDLEMPGPPRFFGAELAAAVRRGDVDEKAVDEKVRRLLRLLARTGALDERGEPAPEEAVDRPDHRALAKRASAESIVLLRNESGVLPFAPGLRRLAVIGPNARRTTIQGGGSARVSPHYETNVLAALCAALGPEVEVVFAEGCTNFRRVPVLDGLELEMETFTTTDLSGTSIAERRVRRPDFTWLGSDAPVPNGRPFSARLRGTLAPATTGLHRFSLTCVGRARLFVDGALVVDGWTAPEPGDSYFGFGNAEVSGELALEAGRAVELVIEHAKERPGVGGLRVGHHVEAAGDSVAEAAALARSADAAVVVIGLDAEWESEGGDRASLALPGRQDELVAAVCAAQPRTAVVVNAGAPVEMPWADSAAAVLFAWYGGQEIGNAVADVLLGTADPSGRLPTSFPRRLEDVACHAFADARVYPGRDGKVIYAEGVFSGYRHFDAHRIAPRFPFGHGLSYARFEYGPLTLARGSVAPGEAVEARIEIRNAGARPGQEVVQLYVADLDASVPRPKQELAAFAKLALAPGEAATVVLKLEPRAFAFFDVAKNAWVVEPGSFELRAGRSSRAIRSTARVRVEARPTR